MLNKFIGISLILVTIILTSCGPARNTQDIAVPDSIYPVDIRRAALSQYTPTIDTFGSLSFTQKTDISLSVEGTLIAIYVEEGDRIQANQLLARAENIQLDIRKRQAEAELTSANAAYRLTQTKYSEGRLQIEARLLSNEKLEIQLTQKHSEIDELDRTIENKSALLEVDGISQEQYHSLLLQRESMETEYQSLLKDIEISKIGLRDEDIRRAGRTVPESAAARKTAIIDLNTRTLAAEVEVAHARVITAQAELDSVNLLLRDLDIRAKSGGILGAKYMEPGERIKPGDPIFTTFQSDEIYATFPVQESDAIYLYEDQPCEITVPAARDLTLEARIAVISPTIDPQSGNLQIKAKFENPDRSLRPGMFVKVQINSGESRERLMIPQSAIVHKRGNTAEIYKVIQNRAYLREIEIGVSKAENIEVTSGLETDELYINEPPPFLKEGVNVEAK